MPPHNLPAQLTRFVGREAELDQIAEQLNSLFNPDASTLDDEAAEYLLLLSEVQAARTKQQEDDALKRVRAARQLHGARRVGEAQLALVSSWVVMVKSSLDSSDKPSAVVGTATW